MQNEIRKQEKQWINNPQNREDHIAILEQQLTNNALIKEYDSSRDLTI